MMQGPSPTKDDLKIQIEAMAAQAERDARIQGEELQQLRTEANAALQAQSSQFQAAATQYKNQYEAKAEEMSQTIKKMAQVEIDQRKARTQMQFSGVLTDASSKLRAETAEIARLRSAVDQMEKDAERQIAEHRTTLMTEANQAMQDTRQAVTSEAQLALNQQELELRNAELHAQALEMEASSSFLNMEEIAETKWSHAEQDIYRLKSELAEQVEKERQQRIQQEELKKEVDKVKQLNARGAEQNQEVVRQNSLLTNTAKDEIQRLNEILVDTSTKHRTAEERVEQLIADNASEKAKADREIEQLQDHVCSLQANIDELQASILAANRPRTNAQHFDLQTPPRAKAVAGDNDAGGNPTQPKIWPEVPNLGTQFPVDANQPGVKAGGNPAQAPEPQNAEDNFAQAPPAAAAEPAKDEKIKYHESEEIKLDGMPNINKFREWRLLLKEAVGNACSKPDLAFQWIHEVEQAKCWEDLADPGLFHILDAKLSTALSKIVSGEFKRQVMLKKEQASQEGKMIKGRQILWLIYEQYKLNVIDGNHLNLTDLYAVQLHGDNVVAFLNDWDGCISQLVRLPPPEEMEHLFLRQLKRSRQLELTISLYEQDVSLRGEERSYERLRKMINTYLATKKLDNNRNKSEQGRGRDGGFSNPAQQGDCQQFLKSKGKCSRGKDCPYRHDWNKIERRGRSQGHNQDRGGRDKSQRKDDKKGKGRGRGRGNGKGQSQDRGRNSSRSQSEGGRKRSESRQSHLRGKSPSGKPNRFPCKFYLDGKCTKGKDCNDWHPQQCKAFQKGKCEWGDRCSFLHPAKLVAARAEAAKNEKSAAAKAKAAKDKAAKKKAKAKAKGKARANVAQETEEDYDWGFDDDEPFEEPLDV